MFLNISHEYKAAQFFIMHTDTVRIGKAQVLTDVVRPIDKFSHGYSVSIQ